MSERRRSAVPATCVLLVSAALVAACGPPAPVSNDIPTPVSRATSGPVGDGATPATPVTPAAPGAPVTTSATSAPPTTTTTTAAAPSSDELAGIVSREVPEVGDRELVVVPGSVPAPGPGDHEVRVAVAVEGGVPADGAAFAAFVMATLNDERSWPHEGYTFARTDDRDAADVTVVLASPVTTERLCRPLVTYGKLSCRVGDRSVLTFFRWVQGIPEYSDDLTAYRRYLVNHEVGHFLGKGHVPCPGAGALAPVMMQQTKGLDGCARNSWPHP